MPTSYRWAHNVLPEDLFKEAVRALGYKTCKVTFRAPGASLGKTERQLPYALVEQCRMHVWKDAGSGASNILYFHSGRGHVRNGMPPRYARWLMALGYPSGVIQAVVGVSRQTIANYRRLGVKARGVPSDRIPQASYKKYVEAGREAYAARGGNGNKPDSFYALLALAYEDISNYKDTWDNHDMTRFYRT